MASTETDLIFEKYLNEAKESPKGKHYDSAGRLQSGDADADGRGGPKFRSDPTYEAPSDEEVNSLEGFKDNNSGESEFTQSLKMTGITPFKSDYDEYKNQQTIPASHDDSDEELEDMAGRIDNARTAIAGKIVSKKDEDSEIEVTPAEDFAALVARAILPAVVSKLASKKEDGESCAMSDEEHTPEEDDLGLGPNTPSMVNIKVGSTTTPGKAVEFPSCEDDELDAEDEMVYIQAGQDEDDCGHDGKDDHDGEVDMARSDLLKAAEYSTELFDHLANTDSLDGWVASKITKASDYLSSVAHYLDYQDNHEQVEDEEDDTAEDTGFAGAKGIRPLNVNFEDGE